jgi:hypothetical protein
MIAYWSSTVALLIAVVGCGYLITATILISRFVRTPTTANPAAPTVTILKPLYGRSSAASRTLMTRQSR